MLHEWNKMRDGGCGMGSLVTWAREDNLAEYERITRVNRLPVVPPTDVEDTPVRCSPVPLGQGPVPLGQGPAPKGQVSARKVVIVRRYKQRVVRTAP